MKPLKVFGLYLDGIEIRYSNKGLRFWEAGCTWMEDPPVLQLRKVFETKERYLGLISKQELIEHEAVHALRFKYDEPRFEEVLAYQTSRSPFRRYFGPFFRTPKESLLFMALLALVPLVFPYGLLPLGSVVTCGLVRLVRTQRVFAKAKRNLEQRVENPLRILVGMTDTQIEQLAAGKSSLRQI